MKSKVSPFTLSFGHFLLRETFSAFVALISVKFA